MEIKVNHQKIFSPSGCVYQKGFRITEKIFDKFRIYLMLEKGKEKDYYRNLYLKTPLVFCKDVVFMNLTQTDLFVNWVLNNPNIEINEKRAKLKANGYLIIEKGEDF